MKRTGIRGIVVLLAVLIGIAVPAHSQNRAKGQERANLRSAPPPARSHNLKREFAPQVIGRANSFITTGRIVALGGRRLGVERADGTHLDFQVDEQTTLLDSSELVSIATMGDITLRLADLRLADEIEVIAERSGGRSLARIVTRTTSGQPVARR